MIASRVRAFFSFWYDFLIGDDWMVALGVVVALALTYAASRAGSSAWWIVPIAVVLLVPFSLWRVTRRR